MKAIPYVLLLPLALIGLFTQCEKEPSIYIPDNNFLNALIEQGVDKNGDGNISPSEAEEIISIYVFGHGISDLTGIEAFVNLDTLDCDNNRLTALDASYNTGLLSLDCAYNQLTSLDISRNTALTELTCSSNLLSSLDISNNEAIHTLWINNMPTLYEVCVWTLPFPPEDVDINWVDSPKVYFTAECSE